jgi:hypothetical protein
MLCCSKECERKSECAIYWLNSEIKNNQQLISWYTHGWATLTDNSCVIHTDCGPDGNWEMFKPLEVKND